MIRAELESDTVDMTPMLDVVFNLLIFFLLTPTFIYEERELEIRPPRVTESKPLTDAPDRITIDVLSDGRIVIGDERFSLATLRDRIGQAVANYPGQAVAVRGDASSRYELVAQVFAVCQAAGVGQIDVLVLQEGGG